MKADGDERGRTTKRADDMQTVVEMRPSGFTAAEERRKRRRSERRQSASNTPAALTEIGQVEWTKMRSPVTRSSDGID